MVDTQAITVRLPRPLYEQIRKAAFEQHASMTAIIGKACIWQLWNLLPDGEPSPVKRIARDLGMEPADVSAIVYPVAAGMGIWANDQEPDLP
jgi:hypothetical protein